MTALTPQILAMYLGCHAVSFAGDDVKLKVTGIRYSEEDNAWVIETVTDNLYADEELTYKLNGRGSHVLIEDSPFRLILRRLEDMKEEEAKELGWHDRIGWSTRWEGKGMPMMVMTAEFTWLLSKSFDLFGLIDAGLAIDQKTLEP